ncbi:MAG: HAMP domain-containing histidine kinase [Flavobacterium sp.]|nr:MAG: HAMP domain-containing histidine kinase [Flavobacterium sp.]
MKNRIYKWVVLLSFLILLFVQFILTYNTYVLKDRDYSLKEKKIINDAYGHSLAGDRVYKGGGRIIDALLSENMPLLKTTYYKDKKQFATLAKKVTDSLFIALRKNSTMDSIFNAIIEQNNLSKDLQYLLTFESVEINFDKKKEGIFIYEAKKTTLSEEINSAYGVVIAGKLSQPNLQNRVTHLAVNGTLVYDYRITFNLFVDTPDRWLKVALAMLPTFLLVALCLIAIVGINYYTYINWMRQKKEAELKSDFLNSIKHEFNTPITTILVASKSLDEAEVLGDRARIKSLVNIIERQAKRLKSHVNQMIETSTIGVDIAMEETDLNYAILTLVNDYKIKVAPPNSLNFDPFDKEILLLINPFVLTTMIQNMLDNSFKHNQSYQKHTSIFITEQQNEFELHIKDNGTGVRPEIKNKIFDKFFSATAKPTVAGLGLGLYYVRQSLDMHGWQIRLDTTAHAGTDFIIVIPKNQTKTEA